MATTEPQKWSATLGANADVNSLPATTPAGSGRASTSGLFPQITQKPLDEGGIAPERGDFNALFKYLGEYIYYAMQGGVYTYVTTYDYTAGNLVLHGGSLYLCIASNGPGSAVKYPTDAAYWRQLALTSQLPTVNNGTLTIQNNGATVATFSANQAGNTTANISAPAVNNGTLTIQKDGATVATFSANQAGNTTANISISEIDSQGAGWVRFKNGFQICGQIASSHVRDFAVNFPMAFTSVWSVTITNNGYSADTHVYGKVDGVGTSSFAIHANSNATAWYWMAIGTWK